MYAFRLGSQAVRSGRLTLVLITGSDSQAMLPELSRFVQNEKGTNRPDDRE